MRRSTIAGILSAFALCLGLVIPVSRSAMSAGGPGFAIGGGIFDTPARAAEKKLALLDGVILRTLVYHELTALNQSPVAGIGGSSQAVPILSRNGNRAAFVLQTGPGEFRVFVINADGSGQREVDSYTNVGGTILADMSADGERILTTDGTRIRMVNADGTNPHEVIRVSQGFIQLRLSADGTKVFFTNDRDFSVGSENLTAGLYVINSTGSGRRQIVSGANIGALLGAPAGGFSPVSTSGTSLDASADASRIIFGASIQGKGQYLLGVNFDGSGLHQILGPVDFINHAAISGDGLRAAYDMTLPPCCSTPGETGVINFDGTQKKPLATDASPFRHDFYPGTSAPMQLSADGSRLLLGTGVLFNTATGEALQLAARGGFFTTDPSPLVNEGMLAATMNSSGARFLYLAPNSNNVLQLATLDLNSANTGLAPTVTDPKLDPTFVITDGRGRSTLSAKVSATGMLVRVNNAVLFKGLTNANAFNGLTDSHVDSLVLLDDGANGDAAAGDGIFTSNRLGADCCAVLGPRLARVKAEVRASDGKRHATAIDFEPLTVTDRAPSIDVSQTSLDFGGVNIGQSKDLTLTIRNIGSNQLTVNSLTSDNARFTAPSPTAPFTIAPGGQQIITVRFTPSAVGPQGGRLTISSTDPARPSIDVFLSGVGVASSCTYSIAPASQNFGANGGNAGVTVTTQANCAWTATSNAGFIAITSGTPGNGSGVLNYSVSVNTGAARSGTITIAGQTFTVTQDAAASCTYSIAPTSQSFNAGGGAGSVNVTTQANCAWTATSNAGFITITSGTPGNGGGVLNYSVAVNTGASARTGTITIAGQTFTVNQSGMAAGGPLIRIEPSTLSFNVARGQSLNVVSSQPDQVAQTGAAYAKNEQEKEREDEGDHAQERLDWFYRQRQYPLDRIPERARELAIAEKTQARERMQFTGIEAAAEALAAQWTHLGPTVTTSGAWGRVSGRVTSIIVHPTNPNIVYISGAQGGVWRTTDNGGTWAPLTDDQPSLAMGALAFDPNNPSVIYAGTGEQDFSLDSYYGNGVLKSTNGGVTWEVLGAATFARQTVSRIVVSPNNSQAVLAATNNGLFRSADGGAVWTRVLAGVATDVIATPGSGSVFYSAIHSAGVFKSNDGGVNWTKLTSGLPGSAFGRIHLTISVSSPNTLLASFTARDNTLEGLYRSNDAGANWTKLANTPNIFGKQGWYNVSLGVHLANPNVIYFGGLSLWRSTDGGATWANISNPRDLFQDVHPDHHAFAFNPQNPAVIWLGCDGGVWRSDNGGETWLSRNDGLSLTQFQTVALHPTGDAPAFGGTQDNGIQKYTGNSEWRETRTGDNGSTFFDFNNPATVYTTYIFGLMLKSLSSGEPDTWSLATNGIPFKDGVADGRSAFYAPFTMDPTNPQRLAYGSYRVWYTTDGAANWNAISGDVTGGGVITAITIAAGGARIWTGSSDAQVWRGDLNGGSWSFSNVGKAPLPGRVVTRIAAHPSDPQTAYISYSGFNSEHLFRTTDGGATWTSANNGLPDIPINVVLVDPNNPGTVYAGTDVGVYRSTEQGQNWTPFGTGLPNVAVFDLALRRNSNLLRAATHGRGMWEIQAAGEQSFTIYNDGDATLSVTGVSKQNNAAWLSFTTPSAIPFDIPPKSSAPVRVSVNATGLNSGLYTERLLVASTDASRSPYPTGVFINLSVTGDGGGGGCTFTLSPTSQGVNASGGAGIVNVAAPNGCAWTAKANDPWITITLGASGAGAGAVSYSVAANSGAARAGALTIAGQTFTVTQSGGSNCAFTLAPASQSFTAAGGAGNVNVTSQSGCNWTASSAADWITITSGASGVGNGQVSYLVASINTTATRSGALTVAGRIFIVTQSGGGACVFTITPANQTFSASGGGGSISVSTQSNCNWTARTDEDWIAIVSGASGGGSGAVSYRVAVNASPIPRAGLIIVAGQSFIVGQAGTGATCGLSPISIGQKINGALTATDCRSPTYGSDFYADLWFFTAKAGQQVAIQLNSSEFDAYLILIGPDGEVLDEDDDGGGGLNARIPVASGFAALPLDGVYLIEASSALVNELGKYTLSLTAPGGCAYAIAPTAQSIAASGGAGSVNVTSQSGCAWTAASNVDWIAVTSGASGAGNGAVSFSVAANTSAGPRTGALTIAGQISTITQAGGSNCTFTLTPTSQNFTASGGAGNANVTSQSGCNWTVSSNADWITVTSGASGVGNGAINYSVAANNGAARAGALTIAGQTLTITQSANSSCAYTLAPTSRSIDNKGGGGNVNVSAPAGCAWTAGANAPWISLQTGTESGKGNGAVGYTVAVNNSSAARSGVITIGGQTFTINQAGAGGGSLSGAVRYCISPKPVPGVVIAANGTPSASLTTGASGVFQFAGLGAGAYTLTPSKSGDVNGVSAFDAALVALHVVGATTLNSCQQVAANADNDGSLSFSDALLIAQSVVGLSNPANFTGTWKFVPPSRSYQNLSGDQTGQNFDAALTGDVSGNWSPNAGNQLFPFSASPLLAALQTTVSLPAVDAVKGTTITIPINAGDLTGRNVIAYDFDLTFDPNLLQPATPPFEASGTLSSALTITANATTGRLRLAAFGASALSGAGAMLKLKFNVIGAGATTGLTWRKFTLNEDTLAQTALTNGSVTVPPAVASVSAASFSGQTLAAESIVAAFGAKLATGVVVNETLPLPTSLAGTTVRVRDSAGVERLAPLFFVAPQQVNYLIPIGTAPGPAIVTVVSGDGSRSLGAVNIAAVAPGLFTANGNGQGVPAAVALRVKADGAQSYEPVSRFDQTQNRFVPAPIDLGPPGEQVFLLLFGTGLRFNNGLGGVACKLGGIDAPVLFAGAQGGLVGLDQVNLNLPRSLAGRGEVDLILTVDGAAANTVRVAFAPILHSSAAGATAPNQLRVRPPDKLIGGLQ